MKKKSILMLIAFFLFATVSLFSQDSSTTKPYIDFGNTAWVLISAALVMFMTMPALGLFYGGLVRKKNVLSILMKSFISLAVISILWVVVGYSLSFGHSKGILSGFIGGFDWAFLKNISPTSVSPYFISQATARIPHLAFVIFQGMFAVITPALIIGAFAERMKFSSYLIFIIAWSLFVYFPVTHWIWASDGWLAKMGVIDFAGGMVVHVNAGIASLVTAIMIGKRKGKEMSPPHNLTYTILGAAMLWFGWFGFNAGSALAADGLAANAFIVTNTAAAVAALAWALMDWIFEKKPTILGAATGAIAGLATITPAAGFVGIFGAIVIGLSATIVCYIFVMFIKTKLGYDDALDAFGVHGIGGIVGSILVGIFATSAIQSSHSGLLQGNAKQFLVQLLGVIVVAVYSLIITFVIYKIIDITNGVRVKEKSELMGLDITEHEEKGYTIL